MIGIFDSGVGGLTVLREIIKNLPGYDVVYFGDTARTPYGNKSKETIIKYALEDADFIIERGAKIIVIACNTVSSLAYEELKKKYPDTPIFEVITPAVEAALASTKNNKVGIIGTRATINSGIYETKLKEKNSTVSTVSRACSLFVPFIEEGWTNNVELKMIARRYLAHLKNSNIDTLILGCTHYLIIKDIIQKKIGERVKLIDSAGVVSEKVKKFLENNDLQIGRNGKLEIFVSDKTTQCQKIANRVLGSAIIQQI